MNPNTIHPSRRQNSFEPRSVLTAALAFMLAQASLVLAQPEPIPTTTLRGQLDRWTGPYGSAAVPYVKIHLLDISGRAVVAEGNTDSEGTFRFRDVRPGEYMVRVKQERLGCREKEFIVTIENGKAPSTDFSWTVEDDWESFFPVFVPGGYTELPPVLVHDMDICFGEQPSRPTRSQDTLSTTYHLYNPPDWPVVVFAETEHGKFRGPLWVVDIANDFVEEDVLPEWMTQPARMVYPVGDTALPWTYGRTGFDGGLWKGNAELQLSSEDLWIHGVLLTTEGFDTIRDLMLSTDARLMDSLPTGSVFLGSEWLSEED